MKPEPLQGEFEAKFIVHRLREHHVTSSTQHVYLCAGRNTKHTSQPFTFSLNFEMTLGKNTTQALLLQKPQVMLNSPFSLLLQGRGKPGHLNSRSHRMPAACKQYGHTTHYQSHTVCTAIPVMKSLSLQ